MADAEVFFELVLDVARWTCGSGVAVPGSVVRQRLAQPGHGAVEMVQVEGGAAVDGLVGKPAGGLAVGAGGEQAMQDGEEHGAFDVELEAAGGEGAAEGLVATGEFPERFEHESGPEDAGAGAGGEGGVAGSEDGGVFGEAGGGEEQAVEGAGGLELVEAAEGGEDALADPVAVTGGLDELDVGMLAGGLGAEEHGADACHYIIHAILFQITPKYWE